MSAVRGIWDASLAWLLFARDLPWILRGSFALFVVLIVACVFRLVRR